MGFFDKLLGKSAPDTLGAPVAGECVAITQVSDPTFGQEILGKGVAIRPSEGKVFSPCDGTVDMMFETGHAVNLVAACGAEVLVHVGLDTVKLKGEHFTAHVKDGDKVTRGQLLMEFDREAIVQAGYDTIVPMVICNSDDFSLIRPITGQTVAPGDTVLELTHA